jgi:spore germination cell wall hydrolase CwlJ-like protein
MIRFARAIGYAVAGALVAASPTFANSTSVDAPLAPTYLSHTVSMLDGASVPDPASEALQAAPVAPTDIEIGAHAAAAIETTAEPEIAKAETRSLGELVTNLADARVNDGEQECLAGAIYFEAKGEPLEGQLAVAEVVLNRTKSGRFPTTICGVVKQRHQFSFIRAGRFPPIARDSAAWRKAIAIAHVALGDMASSRAGSAMFFHAKYVAPNWRGLKRIATVGNHIFYR